MHNALLGELAHASGDLRDEVELLHGIQRLRLAACRACLQCDLEATADSDTIAKPNLTQVITKVALLAILDHKLRRERQCALSNEPKPQQSIYCNTYQHGARKSGFGLTSQQLIDMIRT